MEFIQPILLWGLLGFAIPIAIHLWNGKKGVRVHWAAMAWLSEQENQSSKSIRLDQWLILLLRLVLLLLLILILSRLILPTWSISEEKTTVHLVAPVSQVYEEYRFEIEQAEESGAEVFWLEPGLSAISDEVDFTSTENLQIQQTTNKLESSVSEIHLYLPNSQNSLPKGAVVSPFKPVIHLAEASAFNPSSTSIKVDSLTFLQVSQAGILSDISSEKLRNQQGVKEIESLPYFLDLDEEERMVIEASLNSIEEVMHLNFEEVESMEEASLIFSNSIPTNKSKDQLYFLTGNPAYSYQKNEIIIPESLTFEESEQVQNGTLPEFLMREISKFLGFKPMDSQVSKEQVESRFIIDSKRSSEQKSGLEIALFALFLVTFVVERVLSNKKGI